MNIFSIARTTFFACGMALAAASAHASTVASLNIDNGDLNIGVGASASDPFDVVEAIQLTADFDAFIDLTFDPDTLAEYTLAADLTVDGALVFDESISVVTTATDLVIDAIDLVSLIDGFLPGLVGNLLNEALDGNLDQSEVFAGVWLGLDFDFTDADITDGTLAGSLTAVLSGDELADPSILTFLSTPGVPFSGSATWSVDTGAAVVPLPATAPLLAFAMLGLVGLRRRLHS